MRKFTIIAALLLTGNLAFCQFHRMPKHELSYKLSIGGVKLSKDTLAWRFTLPTATYLFPQRQLGTSIGIGPNWMHYNSALQSWYTDFAINFSLIGAGNTTPTPYNFISFGAFAVIKNGLFALGPVYTLPASGKKGGIGAGFNFGFPL